MEIQPIVIGTSGHIDHGKSTLVRALTGVDPDRLKEEKERGLTIDLGFAPLELPDGRMVGIVDVPGHERFIRNMVAGATGIDLVVLVVAADDAVMPQTREHLLIMQLLGVERGLVALTKIDMVDAELVDLAEEDVRECVQGTFLEDAPIHRVSAVTGEGLEAFKETLFRLAGEAEPRPAEGVFRMPVQRVFSKRGFGTVVTGIPQSGVAKIGDQLEVLPAGVTGRVRGLNAYREAADSVRAGHSSAVNLSDVDHKRVSRGDVVATPGFFKPQRMVAARFTVLASLDRPITNRLQVRLHTGTTDVPGEVVLLDKEEIGPGESGLIQLRLQDPVVCAPGDRFVLRLLSPIVTLGGGAILEESRYRLKRFKSFVLEELERQEQSMDSLESLLDSVLARRGAELVPTEELATSLKRSRPETKELLGVLEEEGRASSPRPDRWIHAEGLEAAREVVREAIEGWFSEASHRSVVDVLELKRRTGLDATLLAVVLEGLEELGEVEQLSGGRVRPQGREAALSDEERARIEDVRRSYESAGFQPPATDELAAALSRPEAEIRRSQEFLRDATVIDHVGGELYFARSSLDLARRAITENCEKNRRLEIPELRDRLGTTRKYLIPLLEYFDAQGLTIRQGGNRVLRRR